MITTSKAVTTGVVVLVLLAGGGYVAASDIGGELQITSLTQGQEGGADGDAAQRATAERTGTGSNDAADRSSTGSDDEANTGDEAATARATNAAPSAEAGENRTVPEGRVTALDATGSSDSDGEIRSYAWRQTDGPNVAIEDPETSTASFTAPSIDAERANLTFVLTVRDDDGTTATDTVTVTVNRRAEEDDDDDHLPPPSAEAGSDRTVDEDATVTLDATASSDPDGSVQSYAWTQTAGPDVALSEPDAASTTFTAPSVESAVTLTFEVRVTDDDGRTDADTVEISVEPVTGENSAPSDGESYTRDEIARAKYDAPFSDLGAERAGQVEELYLRQPFANATSPGEIRTRDELANERYESDFDGLDRNQTVDVQRAFDGQFGAAGSEGEHSRDEISLAKYDYEFRNLSTETAGEMEELYNRQPFADGMDPEDVRTRAEIADDEYGESLDELSRETRIEIENEYHEQFAADDGGGE